MERARVKAREAEAAALAAPAAAPGAAAAAPPEPDPAAPVAAAAPDPAAAVIPAAAPAARVAAVPAEERWEGDARRLLGLADALRRRLVRFLEETEAGDPAVAFQELARVLPSFSTRFYMTAQEIRDEAL
ncbi:hypothetical protein [Kitasatospora sp. GP82]|uniref:hypothetical protein n=1 Tax=Kitasatospora sp. GP82 TaxID=3035089 RepID=UPI002472FB50|nr:hypothetical protein [Kitasatospora sp. GP82]MDH6123468.1 pyruvate/2-oxoglutarate dehydrogenase complex dihydrolipoamide acyltransferase (E2) component [Kitasatospora sp. GP82]